MATVTITPERCTEDGRYVLGAGTDGHMYVGHATPAYNSADVRGWRWECTIVHAHDFPQVYARRFPVDLSGAPDLT